MALQAPLPEIAKPAPEARLLNDGFGLSAYRLLTRMARPAAGLILGLRERRGKEDPLRRGERLGAASIPRPTGQVAWAHAASVGEANAVLPLLARLAELEPGLTILLTTGTVTSARFVKSRLPPGTLHQYVPLDAPQFVARFLEHWQPALAIFTEQEVWPNLVMETRARGIPMALVNARMSDRSYERWLRRPSVARALFACFTIVLAQNEAMAAKFTTLGARHAVPVGNLKIDAPAPPVDRVAFDALQGALGDRPRWLAASTHQGEEIMIAAAHRELQRRFDGLCTIIVPRHPERGPQLAETLKAEGFSVNCRSLGALPAARTEIYIADTIGELGTFYAAARVALIGGSLVARGGQNPIEAVRHGTVPLTGPNWTNFEDSYAALLAHGGAIEVRTVDAIVAAVSKLQADPATLREMQQQGSRALTTLAGALERSASTLSPMLQADAAGSRLRRAS